MYLQKLEIQGFKSFAQKTVLEFNRQLTAIVGPNGSGKSNIADAVRWVLGEQSLKLLRGKRAEDVIFAGSDLKNRLGMAEVSLYLNNEDGQAPLDFTEIVVTRRVFRDGQSEYLLNLSPVRLQDIQLLLARSHFGQKTYSVIGQGMVDSILLSTPSERKEFFEEATGVKQYQIKREQAIQKLTATYENLEQAGALIQEIEPRLRALTRQVKRLERREELERELREYQRSYFRYRYHNLADRRQNFAAQSRDLKERLGRHQATRAELEKTLKSHGQSAGASEHNSELEKKAVHLRSQLSALIKEQAVAQAEEEVGHVKRGEGELALLKQRLAELDDQARVYASRREQLQRQRQEYEATLRAKSSEQARVVAEFSQLTAEEGNDWLSRDLKILAVEQADFRRRLLLVKSLSELPPLAQEISATAERLQKILRRLQQSGGSSGAEFNKLLLTRDTLVNEVASLKANLASLLREQEDLVRWQDDWRETRARIERQLEQATKPNSTTSQTRLPELTQNIARTEKELEQVVAAQAAANFQLQTRNAELVELQSQLHAIIEAERTMDREAHEVALGLARLDTKLEDLEHELAQEVPPELAHEIKSLGPVQVIDEGATALELQKLKHQLELTGGIEPEVVSEYQQTKTRYDFLTSQVEDLKQAVGSLESIIRDLDDTIDKQFQASFRVINEKFGKYFQALFSGGRAQLILQKEESSNEVEATTGEETVEAQAQPTARERFLQQEKARASMFSGVEIQATPAGKKLSSITALSGGEKALTSIALICAIISNNPSPFVVLDEVDAALDEANSERFAAILDSLMGETQFITITHNRATMKRADILYGVTMGEDGVSRLLSVKLEEAKEMAGESKSKSTE
ncbi:MAG: chromosome segregation protein SMC [Candidatus Kerfeldbacteria bacterium]|nr:chromosome segregation protein SMC [Candidatus Kerfeldbacteria bacterium]